MQKAAEITFFAGLDLSGLGKTPTGESVFRVVLANTRMESLYDADGNFRRLPVYMRDGWVLEKWLSATDYAGDPLTFSAACATVGIKKRYPSEGEYDSVHFFESNEEVALAREYAQLAIYGHERMTPADRKKIKDWHREKKEKEIAQTRRDIIAEAAPSRFGRVAEQYKIYGPNGREIVV